MRNLLLTGLCLLCFHVLNAQTQESNANVVMPESNEENTNSSIEFDETQIASVQNGAYQRNVHLERIALPLEHVREADVMWSKRIWREIDTKQKLNEVFTNEHRSFIEVLIEVIEQNDHIQVYADEDFLEPLDKSEFFNRLYGKDTVEVWDIEKEVYINEVIENELNVKTFSTFRLKEDWLFDTKASKMRARIIGIAPVRDVLDPNTGQIRGTENLFWIHYESIRPLLAKYEAFNAKNNAHTLSWTDMFDMRRFDSIITKEANNKGERIADTFRGRDALIEAEKIDNEMRDFEFGLWSH